MRVSVDRDLNCSTLFFTLYTIQRWMNIPLTLALNYRPVKKNQRELCIGVLHGNENKLVPA